MVKSACNLTWPSMRDLCVSMRENCHGENV
jgi:hypothetical protein